jgi:hypothetical protein
MNEDYLWDGSGEPDPVVKNLEEVLGGLRWAGSARSGLNWQRPQPVGPWSAKRPWWIAAAAAVVLGLGTAVFVRKTPAIAPAISWQLSLAGQAPHLVNAGQVIETGVKHATMESESIGEVDIDPGSRLRLLAATQPDQHRLALDHGTIHAFIWALPAKFVVDTPAAKTVDLGCRYTLSVAPDGSGFLTVQLGLVAFQWHKIESFITRGAACTTRVGHGPDTPYFLDAPILLTKSLAEFDIARANSKCGTRGSVRSLCRLGGSARASDQGSDSPRRPSEPGCCLGRARSGGYELVA